jgi:hypothetical protein
MARPQYVEKLSVFSRRCSPEASRVLRGRVPCFVVFDKQVIAGHLGRGAQMKLDEGENRSKNSIGLRRCTEMTRFATIHFFSAKW